MDDMARLRRRLVDVLALEPHEYANGLTADEAATLIRANNLECVVFGRVPMPDGRGMTFSQFYAHCFGMTLEGKPLKNPKNKGKT